MGHLRALVLLSAANSLGAQTISAHQFVSPSATFESNLISIDQVRELPNGGALILDRLVGVVHFTDAAWRASAQVGRNGAGPGEYRDPTQLIPLPDNRTLVVHSSGSRGFVVDKTGQPVGEWEAPPAVRNCANSTRPLQGVRFADSNRRWYAEAPPIRVDGNGRRSIANSAAIQRWPSGCRRDTIALVESEDAIRVRGGMIVSNIPVGRPGTFPMPYQASTQWVAFADGRVAIVRPEPFSVEMIEPGGRQRSQRLPHQPVVLSDAHKAMWREHMQRPVRAVMISRGGVAQSQIARQPAPPEPAAWPRQLPPFPDDALHAGADGKLWIRRNVAADAPATFDVIDAASRLVHRVTLRSRSRLVGVGARFAYVVRIDDDDVEHVERFQLPW